ncbi:SpoVR family protein [Brevibacillus laterosporus]|uniref:SpoVR family protein n=1 Tax=Brevibacillus laterosporus TaxID=1465 RepID=UPI0003778161|nr:SpoVR family protein [Brevibacillus laterosporus]ATO50190.1 stage V sporulation protein R [Brevibacillus laterosporus DSM 25]MBG9801508.1 stage V sporulation protein R [Brevibacillus laterosporus]MED2005619.1 SpoVR family protein [Brevibacillus laterosporus]MED4762811.1 SpoVR family protein [Brevibacillus laterosporus]TPH14371.1 SpoVR family protein [Brevibacillus laterosporus]
MNQEEQRQLEYAIDEITEIAKGFGLDFYPMRYEICPAEIIYTFGAYGMPTRYSHWSFGKSFYKMKLQYDLNLSKIYELVINSNPCYAFLLDGNSLIQNKLIVAHVLAHCDFFKNNVRFSNTNRNMVESMAASADRIREYEIAYGKEKVEELLDACIGIQEHIDPRLIQPNKERAKPYGNETDAPKISKPSSPYDDLWKLDQADLQTDVASNQPQRFPAQPEKDLLWFIQEYSPYLAPWQRDIMTIIRDEMLYFWPQMETKIMNEGWASFWHCRILREMDLTEAETIEFAKLHSSVIQPSTTSINPYHLGLKMFEDIEMRFNNPTKEEQERFGRKPNQGLEKIFEVRELDGDISFIRNYLTEDLVRQLDMYTFGKQGNDWVITQKQWELVRDQLALSRVNGGFPYLIVQDGDYLRSGELYIKHLYEGLELDVKYVEKTLPYVFTIWGKNVHIETTLDGRSVVFSYDGKKVHRRFL